MTRALAVTNSRVFSSEQTPGKEMSTSWQDPQRGIDGQEGRGSKKVIHTRKANIGEESRTSLKLEGSTRKAGDPWSKMKSMRGSLGLSYCFVILASIVGYCVINPVRLGIDITVRIFNSRVIREK